MRVQCVNQSNKCILSIFLGVYLTLFSNGTGVAGLNIKSMLDEAVGDLTGNLEKGNKLIDINNRIGDRIEVFLE
jgi:hypothetical protein